MIFVFLCLTIHLIDNLQVQPRCCRWHWPSSFDGWATFRAIRVPLHPVPVRGHSGCSQVLAAVNYAPEVNTGEKGAWIVRIMLFSGQHLGLELGFLRSCVSSRMWTLRGRNYPAVFTPLSPALEQDLAHGKYLWDEHGNETQNLPSMQTY